jgi:Arc/MetJ-type ribon-helix-helix transcriptional regulator
MVSTSYALVIMIIIIKNNAYLPMMIRMKTKNGSSGDSVPPRKPLSQHKQSMTVSIEPTNRAWIRENFQGNGFRSESHLVDEAIRLLKERLKEQSDNSPEEAKGRGVRAINGRGSV